MNIKRRFYHSYKSSSYTSPYIPAQAQTSNSINMTSDQTSTETMASANYRLVSAKVNRFLHKMKPVYFTVLLLLSLPYVVYLGDGATYLCNSEKTTTQEVYETHVATMTRGCVLRDTYIKFNLTSMFNNFVFELLQKRDVNNALNITIYDTVFNNSAIILHDGRFTNVLNHNEHLIAPVPLLFTMDNSKMFGTSGLSFCPEKDITDSVVDDYCYFPPRSRIRIIHSKFNISLNSRLLGFKFRGVFTFFHLHLLASTIEIANNDITTYTVNNWERMTVFFLYSVIRIEDWSDFTIRNNKIYMNGTEDMVEMFLWYTRFSNSKLSRISITREGSRMVWDKNCVVMGQRKTHSLEHLQIFRSPWVINGGELLLDDNKFTTMIGYDPTDFDSITEFLWSIRPDDPILGTLDNSPMIIENGGILNMRNTYIHSNAKNTDYTIVWYNRKSSITRISIKHLPDGYRVYPPNITWGSYVGTDTWNRNIPSLTKSNVQEYMCRSHSFSKHLYGPNLITNPNIDPA